MSVSDCTNMQCSGEQNSNRTASVAPSVRASASSDETRQNIQRQLVLLLHAHTCRRLENQSDGKVRQCSLPYCRTMKDVLSHMATCQAGKICDVPHCASSRTIILHWNNCTLSDCPVCIPIKQIFNSRQHAAAGVQSSQVQAPTNMQQTNEFLKFPLNAGNNSAHINPGTQPSQAFSVPQEEIPDHPTTSKDWHQSVTEDLRNSLIQKMLQEIFPAVDLSSLIDKRIDTLVEYACKIEECMYAAANSREEYYQLCAEKICRIRKELKEKRQKEMEKQQQVGATLGPSNTFSPTPSEVLSSWSLLPPGSRHPSPPSFMTVAPNTTARVSGLFSSSESQLSNSINANTSENINQSQFHPAQAHQSLPSFVGSQQQLSFQAQLGNMNTPLTTTASASVDSLATASTLTGIPLSQFKSSPQQSLLSLFGSQQQQSFQTQFGNTNTPLTTTASASVDSSAAPSTPSGIPLSQFKSSPQQSLPSLFGLQQQQLSQAQLGNRNTPLTTTASVDSSAAPSTLSGIPLSQFKSSPQQSLPSLFGSQQQQLSQAQLGNTNTPLTTTASASVDSLAVPSTLSGIPLSQFKSSPQQNHSHMSDSSEARQIAFELLKEDEDDSTESADSLPSEDEEGGISSIILDSRY